MAKEITSVHMLAVVTLSRESDMPLYKQVYSGVREAILRGQLEPGDRLPSTRDLASLWSVSRNTVKNAFEQLLAEGFLEATVGAGTYVNARLPSDFLEVRRTGFSLPKAHPSSRHTGQRGQVFETVMLDGGASPASHHAFSPGMPALDAFPFNLWVQLTAQQYRRLPLHLFSVVEDTGGYLPLREAIASYLNMARGTNCHPEQVIITAGAQQALFMATQVLLDPNEAVWMEEPGYLGAQNTFRASGVRVIPVPVDDEGLVVQAGIERAPAARLVFTTPSRQFPLGVTMSLTRRLELLRWASEAGAWIIEDDYDCEFRYVGHPLSSLQGLDTDQRVIYIGTFSKALFPSLRVGYAIVPPDLVSIFSRVQALMNVTVPIITQAVLAELIAEKHFYQHIRRMRTLYAQRRNQFVAAVERELGSVIQLGPSDAGMHVVAYLPDTIDDQAVFRAARALGIEAVPLSRFYIAPPEQNGLVLGYTGVLEARMDISVRRLAEAVAFVSADTSAGA